MYCITADRYRRATCFGPNGPSLGYTKNRKERKNENMKRTSCEISSTYVFTIVNCIYITYIYIQPDDGPIGLKRVAGG